jgi:hypothetical protein
VLKRLVQKKNEMKIYFWWMKMFLMIKVRQAEWQHKLAMIFPEPLLNQNPFW